MAETGVLSDPIGYKAKWILPIDAPPVDGGIVTIVGSKIQSAGRQTSAKHIRDLGDVAILPGFVNAHTHLEFSQLRRPLGEAGIGFSDWIDRVIQWRRSLPSEDEFAAEQQFRDAIQNGLTESLDLGVTNLGDIVTLSPEESMRSPIRAVFFDELIGIRSERYESKLSVLQRAADITTEAGSSGRNAGWHSAGWYYGLSPHAPYTVHPALLEQCCHISRQCGYSLAMHLAESEQELELLEAGTGPLVEQLKKLDAWIPELFKRGTRPGDYLPALAEAHRCLVIHGNYLTAEDWLFLAQRSGTMSVVYCPRTHRFFQHRRYPLTEMIDAGVHVAIGTDSRASNPDLSVLKELRFVAQNHAGLNPETILRLGTLSGAEALGIDGVTGSITPGKQADLAIVPLDASTASDPWESILASNQPVAKVLFAGQFHDCTAASDS